MNRLYSMVDKYMDWLDSHTSFLGFLIRGCSIIPGVFVIGIIKGLQWIGNKVLPPKETEPVDVDDERLVQDWRGYVIRQDEHIRMWGFNGYPATHPTDCNCGHCEITTTHYRINTGYSMVRHDYTPTRRDVCNYINFVNSANSGHGTFGYNREGIIRERDFLPKKKIKAHKISKKTYVLRRPGVYTREVDYSTMDLRTLRRNRDE